MSRESRDWEKTIADGEASGESIAAFCKREGIKRNTYCYHKKRLKKEPAVTAWCEVKGAAEPEELQAGKRIEESLNNNTEAAKVPGIAKPASLTIEIGNARIEVAEDTSEELLLKACRVLAKC